MFPLEEFLNTAERMREQAVHDGRAIVNPPEEELRALVEREPGAQKTAYGNIAVRSEPVSRAAMHTKNSVDSVFGREELELLAQCKRVLSDQKLIFLDRIVGSRGSRTSVRFIVPVQYAHIALAGGNLLLEPGGKIENPTYQIIFFTDQSFEANKLKPLPEKDITIKLAMLPEGRGVKVARNSTYTGEAKKGVFAFEDWAAERRGGLFLHAGYRQDHLQSTHGDYRMVGSIFLALSANGKTTTSCKILARKGREVSWLIQDDGGTLMPDGSFHGFEAGGIFVKTEGVNPEEQREIYYGLLRPETILENVFVNKDGYPDFDNLELTSNGRAVIKRKDLMHANPSSIDLERVDNLVLITRGPLIPAISKLTLEQAVALTILGQAMESSAGDPTRAGQIRSEFFYDPFFAGDRTAHANRFYDILRGFPHPVDCFLLNTGGIGEGPVYRDIRLEHTMGILDSLLRGGFEDWIESPTGLLVPGSIRLVEDTLLHPEKLYPKAVFEQKQEELRRMRREAIEELGDGLYPEIRNCFNS